MSQAEQVPGRQAAAHDVGSGPVAAGHDRVRARGTERGPDLPAGPGIVHEQYGRPADVNSVPGQPGPEPGPD